MCVIQEYRFYTMGLSLYKESLFIPWVQVNTMSLCLYNESFSISWIQFYTMIPSLYHDSKSIPWVFYTKSIPWIQVYTTLYGLGWNPISHWNKSNFKSEPIPFNNGTNPISHLQQQQEVYEAAIGTDTEKLTDRWILTRVSLKVATTKWCM